jgi:2-hydroxychromene-2-carboxylate isomerase
MPDQSGASAVVLDRAFEGSAHTDVAERTAKAYARGVFGVPTFAWGNELFFGNDRLDHLLWTVEKRGTRPARVETRGD